MTLVTVRTDGTEQGTTVKASVDGKPVPNLTFIRTVFPRDERGIAVTFDTEDVPGV